MADDLGEKSEQPKSKRLEDARNKGQIPKSLDLGGALTLLAAGLAIVVFGGGVFQGLAALMRQAFTGEIVAEQLVSASMFEASRRVLVEAGRLVAPLALAMFAVVYLVQFAQVGWIVTTHPIKPDLTKLSPAKGLKRVLGKRAFAKTGVNLLKLALVVGVTWLVVAADMGRIVSLPQLEPMQAAAVAGMMLVELALWLLAVLLAAAVLDLIFQRWQHREDLKMTKQEVKDERKSMDGDPETKGRRMRMARDIAMQRIQSAVPQADVVVTNPTHYSVAIRYDNQTMRAPKVVASGVDHLAMRIRQVATAHRVPMVERPPLARALYHGVKPGQEVSAEHYEAVAEILAYVYRLENREPAGRRAAS